MKMICHVKKNSEYSQVQSITKNRNAVKFPCPFLVMHFSRFYINLLCNTTKSSNKIYLNEKTLSQFKMITCGKSESGNRIKNAIKPKSWWATTKCWADRRHILSHQNNYNQNLFLFTDRQCSHIGNYKENDQIFDEILQLNIDNVIVTMHWWVEVCQ